MTDEEIAGYMGWRGPGVYTQHALRKIRLIVEEAQRREREACAMLAYSYPSPDPGGSWRESIAAAIRARGAT